MPAAINVNFGRRDPEAEAYAECSAAGFALGYKTQRGSNSLDVERESRVLARHLVNTTLEAIVNLNVFDAEEILKVVKKHNKKNLVFKNFSTDNKFHNKADDFFKDPDCTIRDLSFVDSKLSLYGSSKKFDCATKLTFVDTELNGYIAKDLPQGQLDMLKMERCSVDNRANYTGLAIGESALEIAVNNPLKKFVVREMSMLAGGKGKRDFEWNKLPETVEYINLSKTDVMNANFDEFVAVLPSLKNLKVIELASCGLSDEHAKKIAKALRGSEVKNVNLSGNNFTDDGKCALKETYKDVLTNDYFEWRGPEINKMLTQAKPIEAAAEKFSTRQEIVNNGVLSAAAKADSFEDVLKALKRRGEYLTVEDYFTVGKDGRSVIQDLAKTKQLTQTFNPDYWVNAKSMQKVWDAVDPADREQLGPNAGQAAFQFRKNKVMMAAVRMATAANHRKDR